MKTVASFDHAPSSETVNYRKHPRLGFVERQRELPDISHHSVGLDRNERRRAQFSRHPVGEGISECANFAARMGLCFEEHHVAP
jgi:hypothetical protein